MNNQKQRIEMVDGIRGLSLLGIVTANMLIFQYGLFGSDEPDLLSLSITDSAALKGIQIFVEGSFMPIFAFLFGYGLIKMTESLESKGRKIKRTLFRRFLFLGVVGVLHSTYLWEGDILFFYGAMGIFLMLFLRRKPKTIMVWGILFLAVTALMGFGSGTGLPDEDKQKTEAYIKETLAVNSAGSYEEIKHHRNNELPFDMPAAFYIIVALFAPLFYAPLFLFGMHAAKKNRFSEHDKERNLYRKYAFLFVPTGLILKSVYVLFPAAGWTGMLGALGGNILALGFIYLMALIYRKNSLLFSAFEAVGKLSMTNYLMQTVICTTIFYGYGLGFFGKMGVLNAFFLGLVIYSLQAAASFHYLKHFKSGPIEKLIRMWTYFSFTGRIKRSTNKNSEILQQ